MWAPVFLSLLVCSFPSVVVGKWAPVPKNLKRQAPTSSNNTFALIEPSETLEWVPCYAESPAAALGVLECARLLAPLDYENQEYGNAILAIARLKANDTSTGYKNSVFINPGGPGGDSIDFLLNGAATVRTYVGKDRDIIAIAPRAVGATLPPVACYPTQEARTLGQRAIDMEQPGYTNVSLNVIDAQAESFGIDCGLLSGDVLPYTGTVSTARDINYVSEVLGESHLAFYGISYGSVLGATIAVLFPDKIDRMVLDGIVDMNEWWGIQSESPNPELIVGDTDAALNSFFESCFAAGEERCAIWSPEGPDAIASRYEAVTEKVRRRPIPVPGYGLLDYPTFRAGFFQSLYSPLQTFPYLAVAIAELEKEGPSSVLGELLVQLVSGAPTEEPLVDPDTGLSNGFEALYTVWCVDKPLQNVSVTEESLIAIQDEWSSVSDLGGGVIMSLELFCHRFLYTAKERITERFENLHTAHPILWVNPTADPVTPLRNAYAMAEAFPGSAVLQINGTGHASTGANSDLNCGLQYILPYFQEGTLPESGTVCVGEEDPFRYAEELLSL